MTKIFFDIIINHTLSFEFRVQNFHTLSLHAEQLLFSCLCSKVTVSLRKWQCFFRDIIHIHTLSCEFRVHRAGFELKISMTGYFQFTNEKIKISKLIMLFPDWVILASLNHWCLKPRYLSFHSSIWSSKAKFGTKVVFVFVVYLYLYLY